MPFEIRSGLKTKGTEGIFVESSEGGTFESCNDQKSIKMVVYGLELMFGGACYDE